MANIEVSEMKDAELILDRIDHIRNNLGIIFATAQMMFQERDAKAELSGNDLATPEIRLLTKIGYKIIAIKLCCEVIVTQLKVLEELESEE